MANGNGNIRVYDNSEDGLQTSGAGASAFEQAARINRVDANEAGNAVGGGIAALGKPAGDLYDQTETQPEISKLSASGALLLTNLSAKFNQAMASDPNDANAGQKFLQGTLAPALEQFQSLAGTEGGQKYAQQYADTLRSHFATQSVAAASIRAGDAAVTNFGTQTAGLTNAVAGDPTSYKTALDLNAKGATAIAASSGADTAVTSSMVTDLKAKGESALSSAYIHGIVAKNPTQAAADLASGALDDVLQKLDPAAQEAARAYIAGGVKAAAEAQKAATAAQKVQDADQFNKASIAQVQQNSTVQSNGAVTVKNPFQLVFGQDGLASLPGATAANLHAAYTAYSTMNKAAASGEKVIDDPPTFEQFSKTAFLSPDDPKALTKAQLDQAVISGHLSGKSYADFSRAIADRDPGKVADEKLYNNWLDTIKPLIAPKGGPTSGSGAASAAYGQRWIQFMQDVRQRYTTLRGQNKTASDLLNPASKDYILNSFPVKPYQLSSQQVLDLSTQNVMAPPAVIPPVTEKEGAPANPNEGINDFLQGSEFGTGEGQPMNVSGSLGAAAANARPTVKYKPGMDMNALFNAVSQ